MKGCLILIILGLCVITLAISNGSHSATPAASIPTLAVLPMNADVSPKPSERVAAVDQPAQIATSVPTEAVSTSEPARMMNGVLLVPVTPRYDLMTQNVALATEMQITRDAYANPPTVTPLPPSTATPPLASVSAQSMTVYAQGSVNLRECPRRDCTFVGALLDGQSITVTGETTGDTVMAGNNRWYRVQFGGRDAYVYSEIVTNRPPTSIPASRPIYSTSVPVQPLQPASSRYTCNQIDDLNCGDFSSQAEAQAHLNMCGNEDRLDGNGNDEACEDNNWR